MPVNSIFDAKIVHPSGVNMIAFAYYPDFVLQSAVIFGIPTEFTSHPAFSGPRSADLIYTIL